MTENATPWLEPEPQARLVPRYDPTKDARADLRLPVNYVKVGPVTYDVVDRVCHDDEGEELYGQCDNSSLEIVLNMRRLGHRDVVRVTLVHEITHAIFNVYGLDCYDVSDDKQNELFVELWATVWVIFQQDNPLLKDLLWENQP